MNELFLKKNHDEKFRNSYSLFQPPILTVFCEIRKICLCFCRLDAPQGAILYGFHKRLPSFFESKGSHLSSRLWVLFSSNSAGRPNISHSLVKTIFFRSYSMHKIAELFFEVCTSNEKCQRGDFAIFI